MHQLKHQLYYFADITILHFKGGSTKKGSLNYVKFFYKAMSIFVKKHYGGSQAGMFNFLIQVAILLRAFVSAFARFMRWIGMPAIDATIILLSFWVVKFFWSMNVKKDVTYLPNMLLIAFPVFTIIFLGASFFSGLYDNGYKQKRLNNATLVAILILLSGYSLLPESLRFSRGILVFGCITAYLAMTLMRILLVRWGIIEASDKGYETNQTVVAGSKYEFEQTMYLMNTAGMKEKILGRVETDEFSRTKSMGNIQQLETILKTYPVKEIIFCEGRLSFKSIIELTQQVPNGIRIKYHAAKSTGVTGSDSKDFAGITLSAEKVFRLSMPVNRRNKTLVDILASIIFLVSFPLHFFTQKNPLFFFKEVFQVLVLKKTWVGYAIGSPALPALKKGVITTTGLPHSLNTLPPESLLLTDTNYAISYDIWDDIKVIRNNYKLLGTKKPL